MIVNPEIPALIISTEDENGDSQELCRIVQKLGVLSATPSGWTKELNVVRWRADDDTPGIETFYLRRWNEGHTQMTKGITFNLKEAVALVEILGAFISDQKEKKKAEMLKQAEEMRRQVDEMLKQADKTKKQYPAMLYQIQKKFG